LIREATNAGQQRRLGRTPTALYPTAQGRASRTLGQASGDSYPEGVAYRMMQPLRGNGRCASRTQGAPRRRPWAMGC